MKTIMMIHGMWAAGWIWNGYREYFEEKGYRCCAPTLRFHDLYPDEIPSPQLGTTSLRDYAADLEREILSLGSPVILMGHSMGGLLAQILASRVKTEALVLIAPAPPAAIPSLSLSTVRCFWSSITRWGFWRKPIRPTFEEAAVSILNRMPAEERHNHFEKFVYESGLAAVEIGLSLLDRKGTARVKESEICCPVLALVGAEDRITPPPLVRRIAGLYGKDARWREFPAHAHMLLCEPRWQEIAGYIGSWLDEVLSGV